MVYERVPCAVCGGNESCPALEARDWQYGSQHSFSLVKCRECGLMYVNPRPASPFLLDYYPADHYYAYQWGGEERGIPVRPAHRRLARLLSRATVSGRLLDVGCGEGSFLWAMRDCGWQVQGIELDARTARRHRDDFGLDVLPGDYLDLDLPEAAFGLVTFLEALEHMPHPARALSKAFKLLQPGGRLVVTVPNIASLEFLLFRSRWVSLQPPLHLYHFSPPTLRRALRLAGFDRIEISQSASTEGLTRSAWLWFRDRCLSSQGKHPGAPAFVQRSWRRSMHGALTAALTPLGQLLAMFRMGPGLMAIARRPN